MDDGHGKYPLPLVVLNSTTMASKRQYIFPDIKDIKFIKEYITVKTKNERSEFLDEHRSSLKRKQVKR
jgi:hypothetical protein